MINKNDIKVLFTEAQIQQAIKELANKLNDLYGQEEVYVVSVLKGSVMFAAELVKHLKMPVKMEFIRLSSYGSSTESSGNVKAIELSLPDLTEKNILIVEDIVDTGYTAKFVIDYMNNNFKFKSFKFCSLLDKKIKRAVDVNPDYYCFDVDDKFLVGYGLDYNGSFRNFPYIGYITTME